MATNLFDAGIPGSGSQEALQFIINFLQASTAYSIIGTGLDGTILLWNEGARRLYGYAAEEVLGKATLDILYNSEDVAAGKPAEIAPASLRHGKWEGVVSRVAKSGRRFLVRAVVTPHFDTSGQPAGYLLISRDFSDEIPMTQAVEKFRALLESAPDAMIIVNTAGRILLVNSQTETVFGYAEEELLGQSADFSCGPSSRKCSWPRSRGVYRIRVGVRHGHHSHCR